MKRPQADFIHAYYESFCADYEHVCDALMDCRILLIASVAANVVLIFAIAGLWVAR